MQTIGDRICEIRKFYFGDDKGANKEFAAKLGVSPNVVSNWCGRGDGIGARVVNQILTAFPDIDKGWLVGGNGEMLIAEQTKTPKIKIDLKELAKARQEMETTAHWTKLGEEFKKRQRGVVERIRVAVPESKGVKLSMAFQHLFDTNPTLALWAATGKDDKIVVNRSNYETVLAKLATLERLAEIQSKELKELKGEANIEPIAKLF